MNTHFPIKYKNNIDDRGNFVEIIRLETGGQVSFSTTKNEVTRGNHFHTRKIERFSVIKGKALIQLRKITDKATTAVAVGEINYEDLSPVLDVAILRSDEVVIAASSDLSVLTLSKSSEVAESYRSAAYSVLEILGLE